MADFLRTVPDERMDDQRRSGTRSEGVSQEAREGYAVTQNEIDKLYHDNANLIHKRAWSWARRTGRDWCDCMGVCHEAFMEAVRYFDPTRGAKFSSLLATCCNQSLTHYCKRTDLPSAEEYDPDLNVSSVRTDSCFGRNLSEEARRALQVLTELPYDISSLNPVRRRQTWAERELWKALGMTRPVARAILGELRSELLRR